MSFILNKQSFLVGAKDGRRDDIKTRRAFLSVQIIFCAQLII